MSNKNTLNAWHASMQLVFQIYHLTPNQAELAFNAQFKHSANSISHSITEALGQNSQKSYLYYLNQANQLTNELQSQLQLAVKTDNLHEMDSMILIRSSLEVQKNINFVLQKLKQRKNNP